VRVALAQVNPTVGDLTSNAALIARWYDEAARASADVVVFPELALAGYPPEDLLLRRDFMAACAAAAETLVKERIAGQTVAVFGAPASRNNVVYNSALIASRNTLHAAYNKMCLPNYGVFDEKRYFAPGKDALLLDLGGIPVAINICEDSWDSTGPYIHQCRAGARVIFNLSASPYHRGKAGERHKKMARIARDFGVYFCYVNLVGGQDELVFDGGSFILAPDGNLLASLRQFEEGLLLADLDIPKARAGRGTRGGKAARDVTRVYVGLPEGPKQPIPKAEVADRIPDEDEVLSAVICGTRDYLWKNGFKKALVGVSGGIDSALTAYIGSMSLGADSVTGIVMPGPYSSEETQSDAEAVCRNLGIRCHRVSINTMFEAAKETVTSILGKWPGGLTEENLQSRLRGLVLMTLSNATGALVLVTGNKSEAATGYCTMYGDTAGGFAPLKDIPKMLIWAIARRINERAGKELIPNSVINRVPTAELRPNQKDSDSLPEYEVLDRILQAFIEQGMSISEMVKAGLPEHEVRRTLNLIDGSEYKRRQYPPGVKITPRAFGRDWRRPLTNHFRSSQ
jgi:NAD+ synthase (glutamine-hydrolysing)